MTQWIDAINSKIDQAFELTHLPQLSEAGAGYVGRGFDALTGTNIAPVVSRIGHDLPRMVTEGLMTIPEVGSGVGAPVAAATWLNRLRKLGQIAGYTDAAVKGTADTGSYLGGAINAATLGLSNKLFLPANRAVPLLGEGLDVGARGAAMGERLAGFAPREINPAAGLEQLSPNLIARGAEASLDPRTAFQRIMATTGRVGADVGVGTGLSEASRQATLSVGPNAVGLTDPQRNPFTPENVAGAVFNAIPMAIPSIVAGTAKFKPEQVKNLHDWMETRKAAEGARDAFDWEGPVTPEQYHDMFGTLEGAPAFRGKDLVPIEDYWSELNASIPTPRSPTEQRNAGAVTDALAAHLEVLKTRDLRGDPQADVTRQQISDIISGASSGLHSVEGLSILKDKLAQADVTARQMPPGTPDELGVHIKNLNEMIDQVNTNDNPVSSVLVGQLAKKKLIQYVTPEELKTLQAAELNKTGDMQFSYQVALQQVTNRILKEVPAAVKAYKALPPDPTPTQFDQQSASAQRTQKVDAAERAYITALKGLPPEVQKDVLARVVEIRSRPEYRVGGYGSPQSKESSWRKAVIVASKSADPVAAFKKLVQRDDHGNYLYEPKGGTIPLGEGGKPKGEANMADIAPSRSPEEALDEAAYRQAVEAEQPGTALKPGELPTKVGTASGVETSPVDVPVEDTVETTKSREDLIGKTEKLLKVLPTLTDDQLNAIASGAFKQKPRVQVVAGQTIEVPVRDVNAPARKAQLRTALMASLEDLKNPQGIAVGENGKKFLEMWHQTHQPIGATEKVQLSEALRRFWGHQTETQFQGAVKGVRPDQQRLAYVVSRLLDDKVTGAAKGVPKALGDVTPTATDTIVNTQPPGAFTGDVYRTFRDRFDTILGDMGYSGTLRDLYTEMAVAVAQQAPEGVTDFFRVAGNDVEGLAQAGLSGPGRGQVGIRMGEEAPSIGTKRATQLLQTLAHEISHIDSFIAQGLVDAPDAFSERRRVHKDHLDRLAQVSTPEERSVMLDTLRNALIPEEFQTKIREPGTANLPYGTLDPEEFSAEVNGLLAQSLLRGKSTGLKSALEVLDYGPVEIREFANGTYRAIADVLQGMKDAIVQDKNPTMETNRFVTSSLFGAIIDSAREASKLRESDKALAQSRSFIASTSERSGGAFPLVSPAMWFHTAKDIEDGYRHTQVGPDARLMPAAADGIRQAQQFISSRAYDKATIPGVWARWFYPFTNLMESMQRSGFDIARPMGDLANGVESAVSRIRSGILSEFTIKGKDGKVAWDKDNELINRISEKRSGPWRDTFNRLSAWQQENGAQSMFLQDPKTGLITVNTELKGTQQEWDAARSRLSPADQQVVQSSMIAMDKTGQIGAQYLSKSLDDANVMRTARTFMALNRQLPYEEALSQAQQVNVAYQQGNELALRQLLPDPKVRQTLDSLLIGPEGLLSKTAEVTQKLQSRPGYRPESLPDDWILRYATPDGQIRYASAKSEHKALWKMRELKKEGMTQAGEVVKKGELKEFTDFDDPDTLLRKFTEVEVAGWNKFVKNFETQYGPEFAAELSGYAPGMTVMKELSVKGLNQWLTERKNVIDRERFDYIDSTMSWAGRLAASVAFKSTRQMKDLMLADPRSRQFPSFEKMVNSHFDNMMEPTAQWSKELKTFSTAMMMGGSLASTLINASQSAVSLVPILIQYDKSGIGPVGAWKALTKAVADASAVSLSSDWQQRASKIERSDPQSWSLEDSKAALYKRNVEDGGINHGIILDNIFSSTDQKTALAAKFGHGNYGPVTMGEMARSPLYLASQLSLKPFGWVEQFNNKISLMAGVEQGYKQGLRGEALYQHAKLVKTLSTYGGGKANTIGLQKHFAATPAMRSAFGVVNNLQQYGYGIVATYAQLVKDSLGKSVGLTPLERRQAVKAFGTMFATQVAVGGALGLPFAAAGLTVLEKVFGIPANQLVRQGLASLGSDEDQGATIAETALNGIGNQMFGIDVSSRLGVSSLLGTSSYRGFNLSDLAGPTASLVGNATKALGYFASGEPMKAATALVPNSFRNLVSLTDSQAKYGDFGIRDGGDNLLYQPTPSQAALYVAGFRPAQVSQKRQAQAMLTFANQRATAQRGHELDGYGQALLAGDGTSAVQYAQGLRYTDPTVDPRSVLRSIVQRAVDSTTEKDLLATGPSSNEASRQQIAGTFQPGVITRQSELQRTMLSTQLGAQVGLPPDAKAFQKAVLVDMMVREKGMPRSQALRLVEFLQ